MKRVVVIAVAALTVVPAVALLTMREMVPSRAPVAVAADAARVGVGALGRVEPASRVLRVSHGAGPEGARVARSGGRG